MSFDVAVTAVWNVPITGMSTYPVGFRVPIFNPFLRCEGTRCAKTYTAIMYKCYCRVEELFSIQ
jgi:hypothetical protein